MLNNSIRILNFDDSVTKQQNLLFRYKAEVIDLKDIASQARFWLSRKNKDQIAKRIRESPRNAVTFLGSGDFHQVSNILISRFHEPLSVIHFDGHPDWSILPLPLNCGSWVSETLKDKNVLKHVIIGARLSLFALLAANRKALKDKRIQVYRDKSEGKNLTESFLCMLKQLPTKNVYLSIDKDCLKKEFSLTNWREGKLSLEKLLSMLKFIKENLNIIGADIAGDYSEIFIKGIIKRTISYFNHPKTFSAKNLRESYITKVNEDTNLKILETLTCLT